MNHIRLCRECKHFQPREIHGQKKHYASEGMFLCNRPGAVSPIDGTFPAKVWEIRPTYCGINGNFWEPIIKTSQTVENPWELRPVPELD